MSRVIFIEFDLMRHKTGKYHKSNNYANINIKKFEAGTAPLGKGCFLYLRIINIITRHERKNQPVDGIGTGSVVTVIVVSSRKGALEAQSSYSLLKNIIS